MMDETTLVRAFRVWVQAADDTRPDWLTDPARYALGEANTVDGSPLDLEYEAARHDLPEVTLAAQGHGTLVVGVGSSFAPVLLSVRLHQPRVLILAGSDSGAGHVYLERVIALLPAIARPERVVRVTFPATDAVRAWSELRAALRDTPTPRVIDVTGGTKSMAAASFYLAVESDIPAVYFRSERYVGSVGAPEPCSGRLQQVESPAAALALHDLRRIEGLWERCAFGEAETGLCSVIGRLEAAAVDDVLLRGLTAARETARALHDWSLARYDAIGAVPWRPVFLEPLCAGWSSWPEPEEALKAVPDLLLRYLVDASAWLARLTHMDSRVRFLRYFALGELAMEGLANALLAAGRPPTGPMAARVSGVDAEEIEALEYRDQQLAASLRTGRWAVEGMLTAMAMGGSTKTRKKCELGFEGVMLTEAKGWYSGSWRQIRNRCAHGIGVVDGAMLEAIRVSTDALIAQCAAALPGGSLADELPGWAAQANAAIPAFPSAL